MNMFENILDIPPVFPVSSAGNIAISSRIRLARNLRGYPFPATASPTALREICDTVISAAERTGIPDGGKSIKIYGNDCDRSILLFLRERSLASPEFISKNNGTSAILAAADGTASLMINEEDHLRLLCLAPGFELHKLWKKINTMDDKLSKNLDFAFDRTVGYQTSCLSNMGTGLRASVMLHLPALQMSGKIKSTLNALKALKQTARSILGESCQEFFGFYQISNQQTLGAAEETFIAELHDTVNEMILQENIARRELVENNRTALLNAVSRAYGLLKTAYALEYEETIAALSDLRLGVELALFHTVDIEQINILFNKIGNGTIQLANGGDLSDEELAVNRAALCRQMFS